MTSALSFLKEKLDALDAAEKRATPGKWSADGDGDVWTDAEKEYCPGADQELFRTLGSTRCGPSQADAKFIAESRNAFPGWIIAMRALIEYIETSDKLFSGFGCSDNSAAKAIEQVARAMGWTG